MAEERANWTDARSDRGSRRLLEDLMRSEGLERLLMGLLAAIGVAALASTFVVDVLRIDDRYLVSHVDGAWMALARAAGEGLLYPPFFDGENYGGTRNMPISMLLHAQIADWTGDYLTSGKILNLAASGLLAVLVFFAAAQAGLTVAQRLAVMGVIWMTFPALLAASSIRNDALPVALQLAALMLVERRTTATSVTLAALVCAVAALTKLTALWAPAAIGTYLLFFHFRLLLLFVPVTVAAYVAMFWGFNLLSDGRMVENLFGLALPGELGLREIAVNMRRFVQEFHSNGLTAWVAWPIALLAVAAAAWRRALLPRHFALFWALLMGLAIYTDPGAWSNHLIDLIVLVPLVAAGLWRISGAPVTTLSAAVLIWIAGTAVLVDRNPALALGQLAVGQSHPPNPFAEWVDEDQTLLSQDPYAPVILGRRPVVQDAFMVKRIHEANPELVGELVGRIEAGAFDRIILMIAVEDGPGSSYLRGAHFGEPVWQAIDANYRRIGRIGERYYVYEPAGGVADG